MPDAGRRDERLPEGGGSDKLPEENDGEKLPEGGNTKLSEDTPTGKLVTPLKKRYFPSLLVCLDNPFVLQIPKLQGIL